MMSNRKPIFDAVRVARGKPFRPADVIVLGKTLDALGVPADVTERSISQAGIALIKSFEGLRLKAYPDPATGGEPWTIGVGHTGGVRPGDVITEARADEMLREDLSRFERAVNRFAPTTTQGQFDALVSLAFNVGEAALARSTLVRRHNAGDHAGAAAELARWNRAAGKVMAGLTRRRAAEARLYRGVVA